VRYSLISISRTMPTSACDKCDPPEEASLSTGISQWSTCRPGLKFLRNQTTLLRS